MSLPCANNCLQNPHPLVKLILYIPTIVWSVQAYLGVPDAVGLVSPPNLPLNQLIELFYLLCAMGLLYVLYPSLKPGSFKGWTHYAQHWKEYRMLAVGLTVHVWFWFAIVRNDQTLACFNP